MNLKYISNLYVAIFLSLSTYICNAASLTQQQIFKKVSKSIAVITDIDSSGSGVVLSSDGYILTNYHLVSSGLPLTITLKVMNNGKIEDKTFDNIKVEKIHLRYHLALLKLELNGAKVFPIQKILKATRLKPTDTCYAVGISQGLTKTITEGLVSSVEHAHNGLSYIQISAVNNPGNSGGAICDEAAMLMGIATWEFGGPENIAYVVPFSNLNMKDFIMIEKMISDPKAGMKLQAIASSLYKEAVSQQEHLPVEKYSDMITYASHLYKKSLLHMPQHSSPYNNIGRMNYELEKYDIALGYLMRAQEISPDQAITQNMLGLTQEQLKDTKQAEKHWLKGLMDVKDLKSASMCAQNFARHKLNKKEFAAAAYYIEWANSLSDGGNEAKLIRQELKDSCSTKISDEQFKYLLAENIKFSKEDLAVYLKLDNSGIIAKEKILDGQDTVLPIITKYVPREIALLKKLESIALPKEGIKIRLPAKASKVINTLAGTQLLIQFPDYKKIGVFDLATARFIYFVDTTEEKVIFTAGGSNLLLYLPIARKFEVWDMLSWKRTKVFKENSNNPIHLLAMSMHDSSRALVLRSKGTLNEIVCYFSLDTGKMVYPEKVVYATGNHAGYKSLEQALMRAGNRPGQHLSICEIGSLASYRYSYNNAIYFKLEDDKITIIPVSHKEALLTYDGKYALGANTVVEAETSEKVGAKRKKEFNYITKMSPVLGQQSIAVFGTLSSSNAAAISLQKLPTFSLVKKFDLSIHKLSRNPPYKLFASSYVLRYGLITEDKKNLILLGLSKEEIAEQSMRPGGKFTRKLKIPAGVKVGIDSGPRGLIYDKETASLKWDIPIRSKSGTEYTVILLLTKANGDEDFMVEKILIP